METFKLNLGGLFCESKKVLNVTEKFNGKTFARTYLADEKLVNQAIEKAVKAREACRELSSAERYRALKHIADQILSHKKYLSELLCKESGKPIRYAQVEIERSALTFLTAAEESKRLPGEWLSLDWTAAGKHRSGLVNYFPAGVVAGISPFNFPMNLAAHKLAPAIATGCPIILKPASATPLSTLALARFIHETDLPKGAVSVLPMSRETGQLLVTDNRIQVLSFTGSPQVGWALKSLSGKKKVVLELGGNAAVIISAGAKVTDIIDTCLMGAFSYSGQVCIHAQRFIVHPSLLKAFTQAMLQAVGKMRFGNPLQKKCDMSVMIDLENAKRVESWVKEAIDEGAVLLCGGKRRGLFMEPTVLTHTHAGMKVHSEEVFGPVICIDAYDGKIEQAVKMLNETHFGLQCGVFTDSVKELDYVFRHAEVGGVIHNQVPTLRFDQMPYGGIKDSGLGREGVKYAMLDMLESKLLVK